MDEPVPCWPLVAYRRGLGMPLGGDRLGLVELGDTPLMSSRSAAWRLAARRLRPAAWTVIASGDRHGKRLDPTQQTKGPPAPRRRPAVDQPQGGRLGVAYLIKRLQKPPCALIPPLLNLQKFHLEPLSLFGCRWPSFFLQVG